MFLSETGNPPKLNFHALLDNEDMVVNVSYLSAWRTIEKFQVPPISKLVPDP